MENLKELIAIARSPEICFEQRSAAFDQIVELFQDSAFRWAYTRLGEDHLAQDVTQEAFLVAFQHLPQLRHMEAFPAWLRQIVHSQCSRVTRKNRPLTIPLEMAGETPVSDLDPAKIAVEWELKELVLAAIERLPLHEQTVTRLFYLRGCSLKEIANLLQVPVTTVKKRLQYARERLKRGSLSSYGIMHLFDQLDCMHYISHVVDHFFQSWCPALVPCYVVERHSSVRGRAAPLWRKVSNSALIL